jgi:hypothetical protein
VSWGSSGPPGLIRSACQTIGSGNSVTLIPGSANLKGIVLSSLSISADAVEPAAGPIASSFQAQDTVTDSAGNAYLRLNVGLCPGGKQVTPDLEQDMGGIVIPPGATLTLNNGGAGGTSALRQCSATVIYSILL